MARKELWRDLVFDDTVFAEYMGEGTIAPMMMIHELHNLANSTDQMTLELSKSILGRPRSNSQAPPSPPSRSMRTPLIVGINHRWVVEEIYNGGALS
ncbi:hypothetical protein LTR36_006072 [Oleoguttula mirabilis]|uniref:Uncharacterized protein n=1 Tax=Oleoguttula mirabilis TaxID=1507867 RepID=A0AAV9JDD0_9PEZI|nr:hypothetical protein LTR36_006072 [Oleoguttula mirabilis]